MRRLINGTLLTSAIFGLVSCESMKGPEAVSTTTVSTPEIWTAASTGQNAKISSGWLREFSDPRMTKLVNEALTHNQNLQAAAHRLRAARAYVRHNGLDRVVGAAPGTECPG